MINADLSEIIKFDHNMAVNVSYGHFYYSFPQHWHSQVEIIAPLTDSLELTLGTEHYALSADQIAIVPSCQLHALSKHSTDQILVIQYITSSLNQYRDYSTHRNLFFRQPVISTTDAIPFQENPLDLLLHMKDCFYGNTPFKELRLLEDLLHFFIIIGEHNLLIEKERTARQNPQQKALDKKFNSISDYIQEHYTEHITLDELASYAGFSKYHFSRIFKNHYQMTLPEYLTKLRISKAVALFEYPELSIMDIAMMSGFSSMSSFNRIFKQVNNCTPTQFRKLLDPPT